MCARGTGNVEPDGTNQVSEEAEALVYGTGFGETLPAERLQGMRVRESTRNGTIERPGGKKGGWNSGGSRPDREMRIVSVYELSGVGEQIAQSN